MIADLPIQRTVRPRSPCDDLAYLRRAEPAVAPDYIEPGCATQHPATAPAAAREAPPLSPASLTWQHRHTICPPPAVIGNRRRPLASVHLGQQGAMGMRPSKLTRTSAKIVGYLPCNTHGNRRRRGEAGRVEARDIGKSRASSGCPMTKSSPSAFEALIPAKLAMSPLAESPGHVFMSEPVHQPQPIGMRRYVGFALSAQLQKGRSASFHEPLA